MLLSGSFTGCGHPTDTSQNSQASLGLESQGLGAASSQLLKGDKYSQLTVEVGSVAGHEPAQATLDYLTTFLNARLNKPAGIVTVTGTSVPATGSGGLATTDLATIEAANRKSYSGDNNISVYIMFLDNHNTIDTADSKVLGLAYQSTSIAIFDDTISLESNASDHALVEKTVLVHEFGHLLGLVNIGTPMAGADHYDYTHNRGHCSNPLCLMNYAVNTSRLLTVFSGQVPTLDNACLADLRAAGGK
ncbi:MAG: hypothetical protein HY074_17740 [Deltaproteobacteria bacterium]|nr:hypothetical protein [Deltaproteobacteria bacterium]